jgi:hypothetical protein
MTGIEKPIPKKYQMKVIRPDTGEEVVLDTRECYRFDWEEGYHQCDSVKFQALSDAQRAAEKA